VYEPKAFNFKENEMNNLNNEKSGMALAAENEIENAINLQNKEFLVFDSDNNIIGFNVEKMMDNARRNNPNGFSWLGTPGKGRTFCVKQELYEEMKKKEKTE
jgi:hypothetical protein